jgi:hypothetical protein
VIVASVLFLAALAIVSLWLVFDLYRGLPNLSECEMNTFDGNRPPVPDFGKPVDYVSWMNQYLAEDKDANAAGVYDGFWRYGGPREYMPEPSRAVKQALMVVASGSNYQSDEYSQVDQYIKKAAPYVEIFRRATQNSEYCLQVKRDPEMPFAGPIFPWLASGEDALLVLLASAWNAQEAKLSRLQEAWIVGLDHARHLSDSKSVAMIVQAAYVRTLIYRSILSAAKMGLLTGDDFPETLRLLKSSDPVGPELTGAIYLGWAGQLALLQALYPKGRLNRSLAGQIGGLDETGGVHTLDVWAMRKSDEQLGALVCELDKYFIELLYISREPIGLAAIQKIRELRMELNEGPVGGHPLRSFLFYGPTKCYKRELRATAMHRAVALILILHDFKDRHGNWPDLLSAIDVPHSHECLIDPFSEGPFIYRRLGDSFLLYSVSEDQIDNSGNHGGWSRWYPAEVGTDFVFWPPQDLIVQE